MSGEEFRQIQKEAQERFDKMTPEQQQGLLAAQRRHHRKASDEIETSFVIGVRRKLETDPDSVATDEYKAYLAILKRDEDKKTE